MQWIVNTLWTCRSRCAYTGSWAAPVLVGDKPKFGTLRRAQPLTFLRKLAPTDIAMEACGGSHQWGRLATG
jgi:hypothetical protein